MKYIEGVCILIKFCNIYFDFMVIDDDHDVWVDFVTTSKVHVKNPKNQKRKQKSILCFYIFKNKVFYC